MRYRGRRPDALARLVLGSAATSALKGVGSYLQYEGMNPSGSYKDNGMAAAFSHAGFSAQKKAACRSHGEYERVVGPVFVR